MTDTVVELNASTSDGPDIAVDRIAGVDYQYVKLTFGASNAVTRVDAANPLPVQIGDGTLQVSIRDLTNSDPLDVAIVDASGNQITSFGGGTQYTEDDAAAGNPVGTAPIFVRQDTPASEVSATGDNIAGRATQYGAQFVQIVDSAGNFVDTFGGSGGTAQSDNTALGQITGIGALFDTTPPAITDGNVGIPRMNSNRQLLVDGSGVTQPVSGTITANAGTGTFNVDAVANSIGLALSADITNVFGAASLIDTDLADADVVTQDRLFVSAALQIFNGTTMDLVRESGSVAGAVLVDGSGVTQPVSGTVTANAGTGTFNVDVTANSIGLATSANQLADNHNVTANAGTNLNTSALAVETGGNLATIAGAVAGTEMQVDVITLPAVDTELPAAAILTDNFANPTAPGVGAFTMLWDGATWDRAPGNSTDGITVNLGTNNDVTVAGVALAANQLPDGHNVTIDNAAGASAVNIQDGGNSLTVDNAGTFAVQESGAALTALQLIDDTVYTDDTDTHTTGVSKGQLMMAAAVPTDAAVSNNDIGAVGMTTTRRLYTEAIHKISDSTLNTISAVDQAATIAFPDGAVGIQITGTWVGTLEFRATHGGTPSPVIRLVNLSTGQAVTSTTGNGIFAAATGPLNTLEVVSTAWTSGSAQVDILAAGSCGPDLSASAGGGTQYTEDDAAATNPVGTQPVLVRQDTPASEVSANGDVIAQRATQYGAAYVQILDSSGNFINTFGGSGGTAMVDDAAFTPGTTQITPMGAMFDDVTPDSVDEGDAGIPRMSANRNLYMTIRDAAGNERGVNVNASNRMAVVIEQDDVGIGGGTQYNEDDATPNPIVGSATLMERDDALATVTPIEGDWIGLRGNARGALWVELDDTNSKGVNLTAAIPAGANNIGDVDIASLPNEGQQTMANSISVAIASDQSAVAVSGTVTANAGTGDFLSIAAHTTNEALKEAMAIGGQLDDTATTAATENNVAAARITAQRAFHVNLRNNGGTELGVAGAPVRTDPTGTTAQPVSQTTASNLNAQVVGNVASGATDAGNPVKAAGVFNTTQPTVTNGQRINLQASSRGSLRVVPGVENFAVQAAGDTAHDAVDGTTSPLKIGARAINYGATPTAVAAADRTQAYADRHGMLMTIGGHPNVLNLYQNNTAAQTDQVLQTVNASERFIVTGISVTADNANTVDVAVTLEFDDTADVPFWGHPGIPPGGGATWGDGSGILAIGGDAQDILLTNEVPTGGSVTVVVTGYIAAN